MKRGILLLFACTLFFSSCKEQTSPPTIVDSQTTSLEIQMNYTFNNGTLEFGEQLFNTGSNMVSFSNIQYYISGLELRKADGSWQYIGGHHLVKSTKTGPALISYSNVPKGQYDGIRFLIGVDSLSNHADPALWPNDHPLSVLVGGVMHWSWNSGYIFIKVEGEYDEISGTRAGFSYHIGRDDLKVNVQHLGTTLNLNSPLKVGFNFDLKDFFTNPNILRIEPTTSSTHSSVGDTVATILHENLQRSVTWAGTFQ